MDFNRIKSLVNRLQACRLLYDAPRNDMRRLCFGIDEERNLNAAFQSHMRRLEAALEMCERAAVANDGPTAHAGLEEACAHLFNLTVFLESLRSAMHDCNDETLFRPHILQAVADKAGVTH